MKADVQQQAEQFPSFYGPGSVGGLVPLSFGGIPPNYVLVVTVATTTCRTAGIRIPVPTNAKQRSINLYDEQKAVSLDEVKALSELLLWFYYRFLHSHFLEDY